MEALQASPFYRHMSSDDRAHVAAVAHAHTFEKGQTIFREGDTADSLYSIVSGRVKVVKRLPSGRDVILEFFSAGDPLGAVAAYEGRPFPASAVAVDRTLCIAVGREDFFGLLESRPSVLRGYLIGLTRRLVELTQRIPEIAGGRVEVRFARLLLKLADERGSVTSDGIHIAMPLSRRDLADLTGTTIETAIRLMSRWGKRRLVTTESDGFLVRDRAALEKLAAG